MRRFSQPPLSATLASCRDMLSSQTQVAAMVWIVAHKSLEPVVEEIESQSDRGCGIVAAAFIEDTLLEALKSRLRIRTRKEAKVLESLCRPSGPLGTFSAKIDLGLLLGVFREEVHGDLHRIREIRNVFAHRKEPRDFGDQKIRDLCSQIWINKHLFIVDTDAAPPNPRTSRARYIHAAKLVLSTLQSSIMMPQKPPKAVWGGRIEPDE